VKELSGYIQNANTRCHGEYILKEIHHVTADYMPKTLPEKSQCNHNLNTICKGVFPQCMSIPGSTQWSSVADSPPDPRVSSLKYNDAAHIYRMSRVRSIPQMINLCLSNSDVVFGLFLGSGARALVYEPLFGADLLGCPVSNTQSVVTW